MASLAQTLPLTYFDNPYVGMIAVVVVVVTPFLSVASIPSTFHIPHRYSNYLPYLRHLE